MRLSVKAYMPALISGMVYKCINYLQKLHEAMETNESIFVRVVEAGSLKGAAEQVGADPSAVSRKVSALEKRLGVKLLQRSTVRSSPTEAGQRYYEGLRLLLDEQAALEARVAGEAEEPRGTLRVTAPTDFGAIFIVPVLEQLQARYSQLKVELLLGSHFEDIGSKGIDVAVRIGKLPDSGLICRKLGEVPRVLVASKAYLEQSGRPALPVDLAHHQFVFYSTRQARSPIELERDGVNYSVDVQGKFTVNNVTAIKKLVLQGKGIHLGPYWAFKDELKRGNLEILLPDFSLQAYPIHALYSATAYVPAKIRKFIDLMLELDLRTE